MAFTGPDDASGKPGSTAVLGHASRVVEKYLKD